jgi:hypothetical protein
MSEPTDEEKIRTLGERLVAFWERAKVTIMWVSTIVTVITTTWTLSGSQAGIMAEITTVAATVKRVEVSQSSLTEKQEALTGTVSAHDARLVEQKVTTDTLVQGHLRLDDRIGFIEKLLMSAATPKVEAP